MSDAPKFLYEPVRLTRTNRRLTADMPPPSPSSAADAWSYRLPVLLQQISALDDPQSISHWVLSVEPGQRAMLARAYAARVPQNLRPAVLTALVSGFVPTIGHIAFNHLLQRPQAPGVLALFRAVVSAHPIATWWPALPTGPAAILTRVFSDPDPIAALAAWLRTQPLAVRALHHLGIDESSILFHYVLYTFLKTAGDEEFRRLHHRPQAYLSDWLKSYDTKYRKRVAEVVQQYLLTVPSEAYAPELIAWLTERWGSPFVPAPPWQPVAAPARTRLCAWLNREAQTRFFAHDPERLQFWEGYGDRLQAAAIVNGGASLALWFDRVIFVEPADAHRPLRMYHRDQLPPPGTTQLRSAPRGDAILTLPRPTDWAIRFHQSLKPYLGLACAPRP